MSEDLVEEGGAKSVNWLRTGPFIAMHLGCLAVFWVGVSPIAGAVAIMMYLIRMFSITAFYHRYFSHRAFETSRIAQFVFAVIGSSAAQRGPLWWSAHHRHHHLHSDDESDPHSPVRDGFLWSHLFWFSARGAHKTAVHRVRDLAKYPELLFLDRFYTLVPILTAAGIFGLGKLLQTYAPHLETNGPQMLVWGFVISTVALYHGTFAINSLAHLLGRRRYDTADSSRNSFLLAVVTLGEGWHNNHHHIPTCAKHGHRWWELDMTYYLLVVLKWTGIIWGLRSDSPSQTMPPDRLGSQGTGSELHDGVATSSRNPRVKGICHEAASAVGHESGSSTQQESPLVAG